VDPSEPALADRLVHAPLELVGRFADASNATLLVRLLDRDGRDLDALARELGRDPALEDLPPGDLAVYKPLRGEQPLWDFPSGTLHRREVAAYEVSVALGWDLVPCTVLREEAPLGPGSLQRFVPHDLEEHYFALLEEGREEVVAQLKTMVVFDLLINNADRKGGHVLLERTGRDARVRLIDHGVAFHHEPKLRTVAWHFVDEPLPERLRPDLVRFAEHLDGPLSALLGELLLGDELVRLRDRAHDVAGMARLPAPAGPRATPWPLL
jgi:uncharacterized repeat protein (TIGR03843 family)